MFCLVLACSERSCDRTCAHETALMLLLLVPGVKRNDRPEDLSCRPRQRRDPSHHGLDYNGRESRLRLGTRTACQIEARSGAGQCRVAYWAIRYARASSSRLKASTSSPIFLTRLPLMKPRTLCAYQKVGFTMSPLREHKSTPDGGSKKLLMCVRRVLFCAAR